MQGITKGWENSMGKELGSTKLRPRRCTGFYSLTHQFPHLYTHSCHIQIYVRESTVGLAPKTISKTETQHLLSHLSCHGSGDGYSATGCSIGGGWLEL